MEVFTEQDTRRFTKEARKIIAFGRVMGWDPHWTNAQKRLAILRAPDGAEINIPITNINANRIRSWTKQMIRHSDGRMVSKLITGDFDMVKEPDIAELVVRYGSELTALVSQWKEEEELEMTVTAMKKAMEEAQAAVANKGKAAPLEVVPDTVSEQEPEMEATPERKIVSERPWLAKRGGKDGKGGTVYESKGVLIVTFDDGTETYKCRECDRTNDNPRSVKMHHAQVHARKRNEEAGQEKVLLHTDHYEASDITQPNRRAIARLTNDLAAALDGVDAWQALEAHELANLLAHRMVEARPEHHTSVDPLTPAQVLARITSLVDNGQIASLHHQIEEMRGSLAEQTARADRAVGNLQALKDMLNSETES